MRLLIVDDEVIIRTGLGTVIPWHELGYELLEPAASGEEALMRLPIEEPNIVLTDIEMNTMSGLELAAEVKRLLPASEVIILTGYDQFKYTQRAIREGVSDYLLKSSRPDEIVRAVDAAKARIIERREERKKDQARELLVERLVTESHPDERMLEQAGKLLQKLKAAEGSGYQAVMITAEGWGETSEKKRLLLFAVHNMAMELLAGEVHLRNHALLVILHAQSGEGTMQRLLLDLGQMQQTLKCKLFAAAGTVVPELQQIKHSCDEAEYALSFQGIVAGQQLLTYGEVKHRKGGRVLFSQQEEAQLTAIFQEGEQAGLDAWIEHVWAQQLKHPETTLDSLRAFLHSIQITAHRWVERMLHASGAGDSSVQLASIASASGRTGDDMRADFVRYLTDLMKIYREGMGQEGISYIKRAIAYIQDSLDKDLTLQQVAKHVYLNPNHFSEVFKRETGQTYIEFVTQARVEKAKRLLDESSAKISEIAGNVGYTDIKYFSQLFKRHTGFTPTEYRVRNG